MLKNNNKHNNGIFNETILFTESDDIFCPINNLTKIIVDKYNVEHFLSLYDSYKDSKNIIIDSRLIECLIYAILLYDSDVIIYNVINNRCENIFIFSKNIFQINANNLNMHYIRKILFLYIFINFYLKNINKVLWNNTFANKCAATYSFGEYITLDYIVNYINIPCTIDDTKNIVKITDDIMNILKLKNLKHIKPLSKTYNINEIQYSLKNLLTLNVSVSSM